MKANKDRGTKNGLYLISEKVEEAMITSFFQTGFVIVGSKVFLNEKGQVEVKIIPLEECIELLEKENNGIPIPDEYTIKKYKP